MHRMRRVWLFIFFLSYFLGTERRAGAQKDTITRTEGTGCSALPSVTEQEQKQAMEKKRK